MGGEASSTPYTVAVIAQRRTGLITSIRGEVPMADHDDSAVVGDDAQSPQNGSDSDGSEKPGGLGKDGTIPADPDGVAAGHSDTPSHFNPEEDEDAS
ncbi:hypothetical protein QE428_000121 [Microbacterium sp. SORGH_AS 505]|nr:hypothetical protein [Microbacterium sp. SORGH_AS_0505]